jgi:hypothetical protein
MTHSEIWAALKLVPCGHQFETGGRNQAFPLQGTEVVGTLAVKDPLCHGDIFRSRMPLTEWPFCEALIRKPIISSEQSRLGVAVGMDRKGV